MNTIFGLIGGRGNKEDENYVVNLRRKYTLKKVFHIPIIGHLKKYNYISGKMPQLPPLT